MIKHAEKLKADLGFNIHAIQEAFLQDPLQYQQIKELIYRELAEIVEFAGEHSGVQLCNEQMYAPSQTPWTIEGTKEFLRDVYSLGGHPLYTTVDMGHMVGQRRFSSPCRERILGALEILRKKERLRGLWFGPLTAYEKLRVQASKPSGGDEAFAEELLAFLASYDYMFAPEEDSDPYRWLQELGAYSPIIHMQQTDGITSSHAPFTPETNARGIIKGKEFLEALAESYHRPAEPGLPPRTDRIVLAFEIFFANIQYSFDGLENLKETLAYWKQFIPRDGMTLEEALAYNVKNNT
jgi:hypothetical protein